MVARLPRAPELWHALQRSPEADMRGIALVIISVAVLQLVICVGQEPPKQEPTQRSAERLTKTEDFAAEMKHLRNTWIQEFNAKNAKAVAALYAPEAVLMRWDGTVHGYDSILAEFERSASGNAGNYVVHPLHMERSGDLGYETGAYNVTLRDRVSEGNYLMVVKRIKGQWKIVAHATVSNPRTP
jgi:ketosteroid isomerase-like protein